MKVTVGLPVYNSESFVLDAVRSIKNQSFKDWRCIIIDDGSTDRTLDILKRNIDDRFELIVDKLNMGLVARLNQLIEMTDGEYFARMDSDDIMHPQRVAEQVRFLDARPEIDVVGSSAYLIDVNNDVYGVREVGNDFGFARLLQGSPFIHPSIMGRKTWFRNNPYNPSAHRVEDYELWLRSSDASRFANTTDPLLYYREAGLPYLKKYVVTSKGIRRYVREYGHKKFPPTSVYRSLLTSLGKQAAFVLLHHLGQEETLMRGRARKLGAFEHLHASIDLKRAIATDDE